MECNDVYKDDFRKGLKIWMLLNRGGRGLEKNKKDWEKMREDKIWKEMGKNVF